MSDIKYNYMSDLEGVVDLYMADRWVTDLIKRNPEINRTKLRDYWMWFHFKEDNKKTMINGVSIDDICNGDYWEKQMDIFGIDCSSHYDRDFSEFRDNVVEVQDAIDKL